MQGTWVIINILLAFLFGVLHQGGVVPSLFHLHDRISAVDFTDNAAHIIYWKTYMPPRHLLAIEEQGTYKNST
jgi:phosphatidylinositol glycan class Z